MKLKIVGISGLFLLLFVCIAEGQSDGNSLKDVEPLPFLLKFPYPGWGPHTHILMTKEVFSKNTPVSSICRDHWEELKAGLMMPDITVFYYYNHYPMGEEYQATHNWEFERRCFELAETIGDRCFCYGISTHLIQDQVAHNYYIPDKIRETFVPNWFIHPAMEAKIEAHVINKYGKEIQMETTHAMDILFEERRGMDLNGDGEIRDRYIEIAQTAIGMPESRINVETESYAFSQVLGSFYDDAYRPTSENWFFYVWQIASPFLASITTVDDAEEWLDKSKKYTENVYRNWVIRTSDPRITPHGRYMIGEADSLPATVWSIVMILGAIAFFLFVIRRLYRKIPPLKKLDDRISKGIKEKILRR